MQLKSFIVCSVTIVAIGTIGSLTLGASIIPFITNDPVPNTFMAGTVASAAEVNQNFDALVNRADIDADNIVMGSIGTAQLGDDSVTAAKISDDAVGGPELAENSVGSSEIAANAVGAAEIATNAVGSAEIAADSVGASEISPTSVGTTELANNAVTSIKIAANAVGSAEIASNAVTASQIATNAVGSAEIANDAVRSAEIANGSITAADLAAGSVSSAEIQDGTLTGADVSTSTGDVILNGNGRLGLGTSPSAMIDIEANDEEILMANSDSTLNLMMIVRNVNSSPTNDMLALDAQSTTGPNTAIIECSGIGGIVFQVQADGDVLADGAFTGPADFAEMIAVSTGGSSVDAGDILVIDPNNYRAVVVSSGPRSSLVAGVYSTKPGFVGSQRGWDKPTVPGKDGDNYSRDDFRLLYDEVPMAVVGIVPCRVSDENGAIRPGDLLVTSSLPGHAMRDDAPHVGTVVGKALQAHSVGAGVIDILVTLQ